jgi:hypothetical protein
MARTAADLPAGVRLTDHISLGVLTAQFPLEIIEQVPIKVKPNRHNRDYLLTKREKLGHRLHHQDLKNLEYEPEAE